MKKRNIIKRRNQKRKVICQFLSLLITFAVLLSVSCIFTNAKSAKAEDSSYKYYTSITVMPGDTLSGIAAKYCDDNFKSSQAYIEEIQIVNSMEEDDTLIAGTNLVVPYYSSEFK